MHRTTPIKSYDGPVRLTPIPWGKRDRALAQAVIRNVRQVTPALVIPWHPYQERIERHLRHDRAYTYTLRDIFNLIDRMAPHRSYEP